ncbi:acyloxyacyl hydrolase [Inquilinus sp. KBS0705]|nr:acyloxyacyl hydrolase [Inquilinus sp. KBS0705]
MKAVPLFLLLLLVSFGLYAQGQNTIGVNYISGSKILNTKGTYTGYGVSYSINTINNQSAWTNMLNVENINIDATIYDLSNITAGDRMAAYNPKFSNKGYFGYDMAMAASVDIKLVNINGFKLYFSPGGGLIYSTKDYTNTHGVNQMLGHHLNLVGNANIKLALPLTENTSLKIGAGMSHVSNSNIKLPNIGLDRIETFIGVVKNVGYANESTPKFTLNKNALSIEMIAGYTGQITTGFYQLKDVNLQLDNSYRKETNAIPKGAIAVSYNHYLNDVLGVKVGTDLVYSSKLSPLGSTTTDTTAFIKTFQGDYTPINSHFNVGVNAGLDLCLGRFVVSANYGYFLGKYEKYVYIQGGNKFLYGRDFYTTFAFRYFLTPKIALEAKSYMRNFGGIGLNMNI